MSAAAAGFWFALGMAGALVVLGLSTMGLRALWRKRRYTRVGWWLWRRWPTREGR